MVIFKNNIVKSKWIMAWSVGDLFGCRSISVRRGRDAEKFRNNSVIRVMVF